MLTGNHHGLDSRLLGGVGVLAAVVESGNFARAAKALGLTSSGVSRAVARLETRLGVRLFDRTPRAVTLTDEGRRFHAQIGPLLAAIEEAADEVAGAAAAVGGRFRVSRGICRRRKYAPSLNLCLRAWLNRPNSVTPK